MSAARYALVGGGVAAAATAAGLRRRGFEGELLLITAEPYAPYERPPLSKEVLAGTAAPEESDCHPEAWYTDNAVEVRSGCAAVDLDPARRVLTLADGDRVRYDELVLATGVQSRRLPWLADSDRVHYLRTRDDALRLRGQLRGEGRVAVLGAGFIGCEVAATAVGLGQQVTMFDPEPVPMRRVLGTAVGKALMGIHRAQGVDVRTGDYVTKVEETADGLVVTSHLGERLECALLVVGIGSEPHVELAVDAGLWVDNGIVVDQYGATSVPHIHAAGDVASRYHPGQGRRVRVEHHDTAVRQGANLAANLTGERQPFSEPYWFWSDQYEHSLQSAGLLRDPEALVVRGSPGSGPFSAFSLDCERITGVVALDRPRDVVEVRRLLNRPHQATPEQLQDASVRLKQLAVPTRQEVGQ